MRWQTHAAGLAWAAQMVGAVKHLDKAPRRLVFVRRPRGTGALERALWAWPVTYGP